MDKIADQEKITIRYHDIGQAAIVPLPEPQYIFPNTV